MRRAVLAFAALLLLAAVAGIVAAWDELAAIPDMHAAFYAKETCSCLYAVGLDEEACRRLGQQVIEPLTVRWDRDGAFVEAGSLWSTMQRARFLGPGRGCQLDPWRGS